LNPVLDDYFRIWNSLGYGQNKFDGVNILRVIIPAKSDLSMAMSSGALGVWKLVYSDKKAAIYICNEDKKLDNEGK